MSIYSLPDQNKKFVKNYKSKTTITLTNSYDLRIEDGIWKLLLDKVNVSIAFLLLIVREDVLRWSIIYAYD